MPDNLCAKCGTPIALGHSLVLDGRGHGKLCCMCAGELIASLTKGTTENA